MTHKDYLEQAEKELEMVNQIRAEFMAMDLDKLQDMKVSEARQYLETGKRVMGEDSTLNIYELYKHPDTRAKLWQVIARLSLHYVRKFPTADRLKGMTDKLEEHYNNIIKKMIASTDKQALGELLDLLQLPEDIESQVIRDMAVSGLLQK
ncbi:hypothetical protein [Streptococcus sp. FT1-106]|uniref:hypothetical protein n=1 Tax=Streptococcus sp. FT1-106 TaxID=3409994 RepID=UPI003BF5255C